jgi:hypothetical protein
MPDEKKAQHTVDDIDAEMATIVVDDIKSFFPEPGVKFRLLIGGNIVECALRKGACVSQKCASAEKRHEHLMLDCPGLTSLIDVQKGNRLVFSRQGSLYVVEETVYFTRG